MSSKGDLLWFCTKIYPKWKVRKEPQVTWYDTNTRYLPGHIAVSGVVKMLTMPVFMLLVWCFEPSLPETECSFSATTGSLFSTCVQRVQCTDFVQSWPGQPASDRAEPVCPVTQLVQVGDREMSTVADYERSFPGVAQPPHISSIQSSSDEKTSKNWWFDRHPEYVNLLTHYGRFLSPQLSDWADSFFIESGILRYKFRVPTTWFS
jgi:hypothetical protein